MLGYGEQPYQTKSMKEPIDWPVVALAAQKRHISLYICASKTASTSRRSTRLSSAMSAAARAVSDSPRPTRSTGTGWPPILADINRRFVAGERLYAV